MLGTVFEDEITGYYCILNNDEKGEPRLYPTDYQLSTVNLNHGDISCKWKNNEFFLTYDEAMAVSCMYQIDLPDDTWNQAFGFTNPESMVAFPDITTEGELSGCCGIVSDIRNILHEVFLSKAIDGLTRKQLIGLLNSHEPPTTANEINKILARMGIHWSDNTDVYVTEFAVK